MSGDVRARDAEASLTERIYAERLAYLNNAEKIQRATEYAWGKAPPLSWCQKVVEQRRNHTPDYLRDGAGYKAPKTQKAIEWEAHESPLGDGRRPDGIVRPNGGNNRPVSPAAQAEALAQAEPAEQQASSLRPMLTVKWIIHVAAQVFGEPVDAVTGKRRLAHLVEVRQAIALVAYDFGQKLSVPWSYPKVGRALGGRDHSTIHHARKEALRLCDHDAEFASRVAELRRVVAEAFPEIAARGSAA